MAGQWTGGTPAELLDDLGHSIAEQYRRIANDLEARLRRALDNAVDAPPDLATRLRVARDLEQQASKLVASMPPEQVASTVAALAAGEASAEVARQLLQIPALAGSTVTAGGLWAVAAVEVELRDSLRALNARIIRGPADAYRDMTASTVGDVLAGRATWQQVQRKQVDRYVAQGMTGFVDQGGRRWPIGSYAEMATRTAAARAWRDQSVASMAGAGIETFTPIIGANACGPCAAWYGKVLVKSGPTGSLMVPHAITAEPTTLVVDGTLDEARAAGWGHPNCRCVLVAALPGLDRGKLTTHDPEREAARDQQRALERDVRDAKRDGTADDVKAAQKALREHTKEHGLARRSFREQLGFTDGYGPSSAGRAPRTPKAPAKPKTWQDDLPKLAKPETLAEATYRANPGAVRPAGGMYPEQFTNNCHSVVNAMEMRARGFDVRANETVGRLGRSTVTSATDWADPVTGKIRAPSTTGSKTRALAKWVELEAAGFPDGARGTLAGAWKTGGGHIFNWEKIDGKVQLFEGQRPVDTRSYLTNLRPSKVHMLRVDDLVPDRSVAATVSPTGTGAPAVTSATQRAQAEQAIAAIDDKLARMLGKESLYAFDEIDWTLAAVQILQRERQELARSLAKLGG